MYYTYTIEGATFRAGIPHSVTQENAGMPWKIVPAQLDGCTKLYLLLLY